MRQLNDAKDIENCSTEHLQVADVPQVTIRFEDDTISPILATPTRTEYSVSSKISEGDNDIEGGMGFRTSKGATMVAFGKVPKKTVKVAVYRPTSRPAAKLRETTNTPDATGANERGDIKTPDCSGFDITINDSRLDPRRNTKSMEAGVPESTDIVTLTFEGRLVKKVGPIESSRTALKVMLNWTNAFGSPLGIRV